MSFRKCFERDWKNWSICIGIDTFYNQIFCFAIDFNHGDGHILVEILRFGFQLIYWDKGEYYRDKYMEEGE